MTYGTKCAFAWRFKDTILGLLIFSGIMLVIMLALILGIMAVIDEDGSMAGGYFTFFGIAGAITTFVIGICMIREDLRLFIQHGIGRRTTFRVEILVVLLSSFALAMVGDLMVTFGQALVGTDGSLVVTGLYQILFLNSSIGEIMALSDHLLNILFLTVVFCGAQMTGMFISLGYYHLNKVWTVVVSIGVPLLLVFGVPAIGMHGGSQPDVDLGFALTASPWAVIACLVVGALVFALFDWLLMRRVSIRPAAAR